MPEAAAWVSVGELSEADGLLGPRELRAMRIWDGLVVIESVQSAWSPRAMSGLSGPSCDGNINAKYISLQ